MKKINTLIVLTITLLFSVSIANAQTDTLLERDFKDVVITENRIVIPFSQSARNISIVTKKDLEVTPSINYAEALNYVPGVDVRQRGPMGVQSDLSIRGGTFEQALVLLNGIKMSDPQTGHHSMNLPISMANIAQIEVVKGPAARIYGQNAFSGAVNVVTKVPEGRRIIAEASYGQYNLLNTSVGFALPIRRYKQFISFARTTSDGYREHNTDFSIANVFYQSEAKIGRGKLDLQAGHVQRKFGANGFYASPDFVDQYEEVATTYAAASYRLTGSNYIITPRVYWRRNHDDYVFLRQDPAVFNNIHTTNIVAGEVNSVISLKDEKGVIGIGAEVRNEDIVSSNLGDWNRNTAGLFGEYRWENDDFAITPGVFINYYSDYGVNAFPGVDASYKMTSFSKIFANVGNSYRIPTYTDLYYVGRTNIGNPDLEPESAWTYEAGYKYNRKGILFQGSGYYQNAKSVIDWTRTNDTLAWQPTNLNNINSTGFEVSADFRFDQILGKDSYLKRLYVGYHFINATLEIDDEILSRYALEHLNNQLSVALEHRIYKNLYNSMKWRYVDRVTMDNYSVFDAKIFWKAKKYTLFVEGTNLFDAQYRETNLVVMPGRWIRGGFTVDLGI